MKLTFFTDLDRTLIYSQKAMGAEGLVEAPLLVETYNGEPISYMTRRSYELLNSLRQCANFIPVTSRTYDQTMRINFIRDNIPEILVCCSGAEIYINGTKDRNWESNINKVYEKFQVGLNDIGKQLISYLPKKRQNLVKNREGFFIQIEQYEEFLEYFPRFINYYNDRLSKEYYLAHNGRKLYIMPMCINKESAVKYLSTKYNYKKTISSGDSIMDFQMLQSTTKAIVPLHRTFNKIFDKVTKEEGLLAGEEILETVLNMAIQCV